MFDPIEGMQAGELDEIPDSGQRDIVAVHESGHAVAVVARSGEIVSITINPTGDYYGQTTFNLSWAKLVHIMAGDLGECFGEVVG